MQNKSPEQALNEYREKIDELDQELVKILAARQKITAKVGAVKRANSQAIYVPEREASMIASRRAQAEALDLSGDLVEDVLRRMMRDSYYSQHANYSKINANIHKVVVVGGEGALGKLLVNLFANSDYHTLSLDKDAWAKRASILADADLVIMAVPINLTNDLIKQLPSLPDNCVLADVTSIKKEPLEAMLNVHAGPVVGLHPMFGPDAPGMIKQVVVVCEGRYPDKYQWLIEQMTVWGAQIYQTNADKHDNAMAFIQVMRHFNTFVYGQHLAQENPELSELIAFSSPIYRLEFAMVGRLFAQAPALYADIIFNNRANVDLLERFHLRFGEALNLLKHNEKSSFIEAFEDVQAWFGDYAKTCLKDSKQMLLKADDGQLLRNK
ncbi:bifunctional chorismate mutase/prephenate dehydrogenase [Glaciecola petra]|uniref:T-protein n=1 Tax=Glaciecola petra TaxID=3075602 RepID=A0ABU2ZPY8_9ALTE|nr:bifunctional chorismate mutase/prephenate dehydrogenase [Aestuariibacter sp. P117]MDT0594690.1 bifunctional chorismate mutase/prephenate dehydrogenase [Aestuariibacter sp. P117]